MTTLDWNQKKVLVTGGAGFLGSHLTKILRNKGVRYLRITRSIDCDLRVRENCKQAVKDIDIVFHLAAKVGGIGFNLQKPAELFFDNVIMGVQLMEEARLAGVEKFITVGTICSYPKFAPVPFKEETLWDGYPEETNAPYGLAKKMLLVQAQAYRNQYGFNAVVLFPTNLYGPGDNFDLESSHVIPALIRKIHQANAKGARSITVWGDGSPTRDFLYVEDAARALILAAEKYNKPDPINLGSGKETSIRELVEILCSLMNFRGEIIWDTSKPNGQPRRCVSIERAKKELGWEPRVSLFQGLKQTIEWFKRSPHASL